MSSAICFNLDQSKILSSVVGEGPLGRSPKASQNALLWPKSSQIALQKGNLGRPSRTRKEGGGEANFVSGRAVWPHFGGGGEVVLDDSLLDLMSVDLVFSGLRAGKIDLSRVDLDFFAGFVGKKAVDLDFFTVI